MAFTVRRIAHRPWPVTVVLQEADAGTGEVREVKSTFIGHFRPFTEDEFEQIVKAAEAAVPAPVGDDTPERLPLPLVLRRNAAIFSGVLTGWGPEVRDETGASIPYSAEALTAMVTGPDGRAVSVGFNEALAQIRYGVAPKNNDVTSPAPGHAPGEVAPAPTN